MTLHKSSILGALILFAISPVAQAYEFHTELDERPGLYKDNLLHTGLFDFEYSNQFVEDFPDEDGNGLPDVLDEIWLSLRQSYRAEVLYLGFKAPISDQNPLKVVLDYEYDLFGEDADTLFGYVDFDENNDVYLALDPSLEISVLEPTVAHEFFHVIQFGYDKRFSDSRQADMFLESTAVWVEDHVFDYSNDYQRYTDFFTFPDFSIFAAIEPRDSYYVYGLYIWPRFLNEYYKDPSVIHDIFDFYSQSKIPYTNGMKVVDAYDQWIKAQNSTLNETYLEFSYWLLDLQRFEEAEALPSKPYFLPEELTALSEIITVKESYAPALYGTNYLYFENTDLSSEFHWAMVKPKDVWFNISLVPSTDGVPNFEKLKTFTLDESQSTGTFDLSLASQANGVYVIISPMLSEELLMAGDDTQFDYGYEYSYVANFGPLPELGLDALTPQKTEYKKNHYLTY